MSAEQHAIDDEFIDSVRYVDAKGFFDDIIRTESGEFSEAHVYAELSDFLFMIREVPKVYSYVTCGLMSKPGYHALDIINVADACAEDQITTVVRDVLDRIEAGESVEDIRDEFPEPEERE